MTGPKALPCLALLLLCAAAVPSLHADDKDRENFMMAKIYYGSNDASQNTLAANDPLKKSLTKLIGYPYYKKLGCSDTRIDATHAQALDPCNKLFYIKFKPVDGKPGIFQFELLKGEESLLKGEFRPRRKTPLIITGPHYDQGSLVLILNTCTQNDISEEQQQGQEQPQEQQ
jgi:hypothetical protein